MNGNIRKWDINKPGGGNSAGCDVGQAVEIEEACRSVNRINARKKYEQRKAREEMRDAQGKAKITLPSMESLAKLLKDD